MASPRAKPTCGASAPVAAARSRPARATPALHDASTPPAAASAASRGRCPAAGSAERRRTAPAPRGPRVAGARSEFRAPKRRGRWAPAASRWWTSSTAS